MELHQTPDYEYICSGDCDTLRVIFYDYTNFGGSELRYYGSSRCSSSTEDTDFRLSSMPTGWNDRVGSIRDYNYCDVAVYQHTRWLGDYIPYTNYGSGGLNMPVELNNKVSSFKVS